jgi:hypothetical protein
MKSSGEARTSAAKQENRKTHLGAPLHISYNRRYVQMEKEMKAKEAQKRDGNAK